MSARLSVRLRCINMHAEQPVTDAIGAYATLPPPRRGPLFPHAWSCPPSRSPAATWVQPLAIGWYSPAELILYRKSLRWTESPWESNRIGCPRIVAGSFVFLI